MNRTCFVALSFLAIGPSLLGCGAPAEKAATGDEQLEIYNWWTHPGEVDALEALIGAYQDEHPTTQVINASVDSIDKAMEELHGRMESGAPPDTFQVTGGWNLKQWVAYNGRGDSESKLEPVDFALDADGMRTSVPSAVLDAVSYEGHAYSVPLGVHRFNTLFYNKRLFEEHGLNPPVTLADFYEVSAAFEAQGIVPLSLPRDGTLVSLLALDWLLVSTAGAQFREDYFAGRAAADDPRVVEMLEELSKILEHADVDFSNWAEAAVPVVQGTTAMTLVGDWAKGFFLSNGLVPNVDLGVVPAPGSEGVFVFSVDSFNLPLGAPDRVEAMDFLRLVGSKSTHELFNPIKGSISPRTDVDRSRFDSLAQQTMDEFETSTLTPAHFLLVKNPDYVTAVDAAMQQFVIDRNVDTVVNVLKNRYDQL